MHWVYSGRCEFRTAQGEQKIRATKGASRRHRLSKNRVRDRVIHPPKDRTRCSFSLPTYIHANHIIGDIRIFVAVTMLCRGSGNQIIESASDKVDELQRVLCFEDWIISW